MKRKYFTLVLFLTTIVFMAMMQSGCKKDTPATAIITVVNASGVPLEGAIVVLHQDTIKSPVTGQKAIVTDEKVTDGDGKTQHEFPLDCILNVDVSYKNKKATDYIRIYRSETAEKTMIIK